MEFDGASFSFKNQRKFWDTPRLSQNAMESPTENPTKAAEYLNELNRIIETQQVLLEKQKIRIEELEQQVADLYSENAFLKDEYQRHMLTCRLQQNNNSLSALGSIQENVFQTNQSCFSRSSNQYHDKQNKSVSALELSRRWNGTAAPPSPSLKTYRGYEIVLNWLIVPG